ncbi:hypothetical protein NC651_009214 [Populus alba x Populus x berolinensis]|nr:hypothetical protein NC651_009214 [Populus alba x Populus x berolinensis]
MVNWIFRHNIDWVDAKNGNESKQDQCPFV